MSISIFVDSNSILTIYEAIWHDKGATAELWETIDRVQPIGSQSFEGLRLESLTGVMTLENVDFGYSSRPDVPIVRNLSLRFPAGKICALVGASGSRKPTVISP